jgi:hypothetical protein
VGAGGHTYCYTPPGLAHIYTGASKTERGKDGKAWCTKRCTKAGYAHVFSETMKEEGEGREG